DQIATMAVRNIIRPLPENILSSVGVSEADFPEAVWSPGEYKGERYSIPLDIHPLVMYYNENMLEAAGLSAPPKNKEEFEKFVTAAKQGDTMGWAVTTGFPIQQMFQTLLYQYGGTAFNENATEATWNSEAGVKALTYLRDAQQQYSKANLPVDAGITAFKQGKSAVEWNGIWQIPNLVAAHDFGAGAPIPQIGDTMAVWAGSHQLSLTNQKTEDPKKTAAAGCFMDWLSANSALWARGGQIPANNAVRESEAFKQVKPQAEIAPSVESAFFPPSLPGIVDAYAPLDEEIAAVMTGKQKDIKQALDNSARKANQILERNAQRYGGNQ
ncbi:MAG: extracellular solute-binding protein, partial [Chloroflexota bacterium]|nr:extracellular solute-binding protein [Chloroflexota bacterium]